jgi:hypothetical protein
MAWNLVGFIPLVITVGGLYTWLHYRHLWKGERPVDGKLLRGPGESLRLKMEELGEQLLSPVVILTGTGIGLGILTSQCAAFPKPFRTQVLSVVWSVAIGIMIFSLWRVVHLLKTYKDYQLGFSGERAVGEELNKLMLEGCYVFHDLPAGKNWNIDHVVIAPSGVYSIETKAPRKKRSEGSEYFKVIFDGTSLQFPNRRPKRSWVEQAERNANWLADALSKAEAEPIRVQPVLILTGWFIERTGRGTVLVLGHRKLNESNIWKGPRILTDKQLKQIAHEIEGKCRTVSF